jgi:hypothetical protein
MAALPLVTRLLRKSLGIARNEVSHNQPALIEWQQSYEKLAMSLLCFALLWFDLDVGRCCHNEFSLVVASLRACSRGLLALDLAR